MKTYKEIINEVVRPEKINNPLVSLFKDSKLKSMLGHVFLYTASDLHDFSSEKVLSANGFYSGKAVEVSTQDGKTIWVQISDHSKYKK
jgi:hypothetical protein